MTRRRQFNERKLLKVYLDEADYQRITEAAKQASTSVSEWIRNRCLAHSVRYAHVTTDGRAVKTSPGSVLRKPKVKTCAHGVERGVNCWQCGGLAVITLFLMFLAPICSAQSLVEAPKPKPAVHRFYDRCGKIEFGAAVTMASADSAITCHNLANRGVEHWQPTQSCAGNVGILFGGVAAQEALAYGLHRLGWHKPERIVRFFTIQASSRAIAYSARHGGI